MKKDGQTFVRYVHPMGLFRVTICLNEGGLSITGSGLEGEGQIAGNIRRYLETDPWLVNRDEGWDEAMVRKLCDIWDRWHLNDMRAGTPRQERALDKYRKSNPRYNYIEACEYLKGLDLYEDDGYKYGTAWLTEEVPQDVLEWLFSLPGDGSTYEDISPLVIDEQDFCSVLSA